MLGNAPLRLVGKMPTRLIDQAPDFALHVAVTGILCVIKDMAQNSAKAFANSCRRCACGRL